LFGAEFHRDKEAAVPMASELWLCGLARRYAAQSWARDCTLVFRLMHSNRSNPMVLIDDLMETFPSTVDREVLRLVKCGTKEVDRDAKAASRASWSRPSTSLGLSPLMVCAERLAQSLRGFRAEIDSRRPTAASLPLEGMTWRS